MQHGLAKPPAQEPCARDQLRRPRPLLRRVARTVRAVRVTTQAFLVRRIMRLLNHTARSGFVTGRLQRTVETPEPPAYFCRGEGTAPWFASSSVASQFGNAPLKSSPQLRAAIDAQLTLAHVRWGDRSIEGVAAEGRRGELMADALLLRRLRYFNQHGVGYAKVLEQVPRLRFWSRVLLALCNCFDATPGPLRVRNLNKRRWPTAGTAVSSSNGAW